MRFPLEGLHTETGPGVLEAAIAVDRTLEAADKGALFKTMLKVLAQRLSQRTLPCAGPSGTRRGESETPRRSR